MMTVMTVVATAGTTLGTCDKQQSPAVRCTQRYYTVQLRLIPTMGAIMMTTRVNYGSRTAEKSTHQHHHHRHAHAYHHILIIIAVIIIIIIITIIIVILSSP